jgi:hypothetical protein
MTRRALIGAAGLLLMPALTGCSLLAPSSAPSTLSSDSGGLVDPFDSRYPPLADVTLISRKGSGGSWKVTGAVHNPTKAAFSYTISVDILDPKGNTVSGAEGTLAAPVKPGATGPWTANATGVPTSAATCSVAGAYRS